MEAINTNFKIFGVNQPAIYNVACNSHTQGKHSTTEPLQLHLINVIDCRMFELSKTIVKMNAMLESMLESTCYQTYPHKVDTFAVFREAGPTVRPAHSYKSWEPSQ